MQSNRKFSAKWSPAITEHGFTSVPNLLIQYRGRLGLTVPETYFLITLESFRWDDRRPWPSLETLSVRSNLSVRTVSRCIASLTAKGIITRTKRGTTSSVTSVENLIAQLDTIATSVLPYGQKQPPKWDKTRQYPMTNMSTKEDSVNNTQRIDPIIKNSGFEKLGKSLPDKSGESTYPRKPGNYHG